MTRGASALAGAEDGIGDAGDLEHFGDVVDADDVGAAEDGGGDGGGGAPCALVRRNFVKGGAEGVANEGFAGGADQDGAS